MKRFFMAALIFAAFTPNLRAAVDSFDKTDGTTTERKAGEKQFSTNDQNQLNGQLNGDRKAGGDNTSGKIKSASFYKPQTFTKNSQTGKSGKKGAITGGTKSLNFTKGAKGKNAMGDGSVRGNSKVDSSFIKHNGFDKTATGGAGGVGNQLPAVQPSH